MIDFLIIGNGLAGSLLAWVLLERGQEVVVIDRDIGTSASLTAAGLMNPITGKRFVKDPSFERFIDSAKDLYRTLEERFSRQFYCEKSLIRIFQSQQDVNLWRKRRQGNDCDRYISRDFSGDSTIDGIDLPLGGYYQNLCGNLDVPSVINGLFSYFRRQNRLVMCNFDSQELAFTRRGVQWRNFLCENVIFCEGYRAIFNPYFNWLPFQPAKGQVLSLQTHRKLPGEIIHWGHWLIPLGRAGLCKVGTNYQRQFSDEQPCAAISSMLIESVKTVLGGRLSFIEVESNAGVRPNTLDKAPFLGRHPKFENVSIFNGFGSKGALLIPWYAEKFADFVIDGQALPAEANITRYVEKYFSG